MDCNIFHKDCKKCQETCPFHATATGLDGKTKTDKITMNEDNHEIGVNFDLAKNIMADKIYESDASALREQLTNALSHGCVAYHEKFGYTDDVYVDISFDHGERTVTIRDNGMGMSKETFKNVFMFFGKSSVSETENNKRSGMFGLGAISFFRIASSCIVESYHRETGEHYSFMTRGKKVTEILEGNKIMTGGKHDPDKGIIGDYGTSTKIYLKEKVKIRDLVQMVKTVGANYPARTLLHVLNSEGEQSIQTYQQEDQDEEIELPAVHTFEDFVKLQCGENNNYTKILDNEFVEVFITDLPNVRYGDSACDAYLCRVPIKLELRNFSEHRFRSFVNIKQEKYKGIDEDGNEALLAIPMVNRDRLEQPADEWLDDQLVAEIIPVIQKDNHFTTVQEFRDIPNNWIPTRYNMQHIYDEETKSFINQVASVTVRTRTIEKGLSKAGKGDTSLWEVIQKHSHIFYHQTCHNDSFRSVVSYLEATGVKKFDVCVIGETVFQRRKDENGTQHMTQFDSLANQGKEYKGMQVHDFTGYDIVDLKEYKKKHTIKAAKPDRGDVAYDSGAKVWLPAEHGFSISFTQEDLDYRGVKTENVYWAGDYLKYSDVRNTRMISYPHRLRGNHSEKIGIIVAKKYPKTSVPNINELFDEIEEMIESGEVYMWDIDNNKKRLLEDEWQTENPDGLNWDQWTADFEIKDLNKRDYITDSDHDTEYTYNSFTMFDAEKHVALTTNNSTILKRGLQQSGYTYGPDGREYKNPLIVTGDSEFGDVSECRHRCGIIFCPSKWVSAVELYFKLKHDKHITEMTEHVHRFKDFKLMPTWTTASDDDWNLYYEEKKFTDLVSKKVAGEFAVYPTVKRMVQWAREGSIEKFENIKWDIDDVYKLASPEEILDSKRHGLDDKERKYAEEQVRELLLELHPDKRMMVDIIACGLTTDDCIAVNTSVSHRNRSSTEALEIESIKKENITYWKHQLFIKVSAFEKQGNGHRVKNPSLDLDNYIDFQDEKVSLLDDGTVVITTNNHVNDLLDDDYFYHNNTMYKKYSEWEWR